MNIEYWIFWNIGIWRVYTPTLIHPTRVYTAILFRHMFFFISFENIQYSIFIFDIQFEKVYYIVDTSSLDLLIIYQIFNIPKTMLNAWIYIITSSLYIQFKGIIHLSQWRKLVDDGGGSTRPENTGCSSNTVRVWRVKKTSLVGLYWSLTGRSVIRGNLAYS